MQTGDTTTDITTSSDAGVTERLRAELEMAEERRSQYVADISHELRTPVGGILGMSSLLLETELHPQQREFAETIHDTAETLIGLLNEILDLAKIDRGHLEVTETRFDLRSVCQNAVRLLTPTAKVEGVSLVVSIPDGLPEILMGDPVRLGQVLLNLIGNALKFTHEGSVELRVTLADGDDENVQVVFEIIDTGIGISPELLPRVFEPFSQAEGGSGSMYGGTGLGLAISKKLVELMGSTLDVESEVDQGSTFSFELRFPRVTDSPASVAFGEGEILVVGAGSSRRDSFVSALGAIGKKVEACETFAAIDRIRQREAGGSCYQMILVDRHLPDLDAETFARTIRKRMKLTDPPLVLIQDERHPLAEARAERSGYGHVILDPEAASALARELVVPEPEETPLSSPTSTDSLESSMSPQDKLEALPTPIVLVVEDNPVNQKVVCHMLRKVGFEVDLAKDGEEGVECLRGRNYDAILMDCQMPVMDGYEATRAIRAFDDARAQIPIVALTANAMDGDREKCLDAGMDDYMTKPAKADQLREMLFRWVPNCEDRLAATALV